MELLEWDARAYDALPLPHKRWGPATVARLALTGREAVLDLGCGTGRDAEQLLERLPDGRVVAVDGSQQMLERLAERLADRLDRVEVVRADLRDPLPLDAPVDAVVSVATLHWIPDHARLFENVASVLRPGGQFVAEAGGFGNITAIRAALTAIGADEGAGIWNFAGVAETRTRLEAAGFREIEVELVPDPARLAAGEQFEAFLATVVLAAHLRGLPAAERRPFVHAVVERLPGPVVDYVRLRISAVRR
ncbi:class I SAM-dependent methyltransferase [Amycolatopsis minnesotensis]|uniref:Class I SAM-dependent methyltransferase n=1 Tax=Amycolatopsis minnesotensis TaxID=337894 RepID=A0ABP5DYX8_9PSEU